MKRIIKRDKSVIPALDVTSLERMKEVVEGTHSVEGIGGYKIGFELVIPFGMRAVVEAIRKLSDLPVIYDHQKAATDISGFGSKFANACKSSGVDAVIYFPQAGPATEEDWVNAGLEAGLGVIVGGEMTHPNYLVKDNGYIADEAPQRILKLAAELGVENFVVPGNKPDKIKESKEFLESLGVKPTFFSPGLVTQGGEITESAEAAGERWHAIVGRGIYQADDIQKAAKELTQKLV